MRANQQLMKGAYAVAPKYQSFRLFGQNDPQSRQQQIKQMYDDRITRKYIESLPDNIEIAKLSPSMQKPITAYLNANRIKYGQYARQISKVPAGSPMYMKIRGEMQGIQSKFKSLSSELDNFKNLKTEYLKDFDAGMISKGSDTAALAELFKKDDYEITLDDGRLHFMMEDGSKLAASDINPYFNRNAKAVDGLLKLNQQAYKNALPIDEANDYLFRRQVRELVTAGGRDGLLSLAVDKFLDNPMINIDDPNDPNAYLLNEENHEQLRDFVINNWMNGISSAANQAFSMRKRSGITGSGIDPMKALQLWNSGDLTQITNLLPLDSKISVVRGKKSGTYDMKIGSRVVRSGIDPGDPNYKNMFLEVLGIPSMSNSIDTNLI